ncbi:MAG: hypothetical protein A3I43_06490 [Omnitrophica WOR_2 bacterium RIFCSPLOWO2_02_FULL_50_19]|nr:MAG: hypothetical protein A3I43_06490 [Omnitrophica WOR_2 bacterium RIFCSPLOWO2_02_FULL_50_19]
MKSLTIILTCLFIFLLCLNSYAGDVESPTAQEVLKKVADNYALINDMKANQTLTATLDGKPFGDTDYCIYYFMKPNKEKTETYSGADRLTKTDDTIIMNGSAMYLVNPGTKMVKTVDLLSEANITSGQFSQMDICYNLPNFLKAHTISRNDAETDFNKGLIAVDAIPNSPNSLYNKLQVQIDYNKGLIIKSSLYKDNNLIQVIETTESQQMPNGAWVPKVMVKKPVLSSGQFITTMTYENISINTGLKDLDFDPNR